MLKFKKMGSDKVPLLLVTANVGSIFEDVSIMYKIDVFYPNSFLYIGDKECNYVVNSIKL